MKQFKISEKFQFSSLTRLDRTIPSKRSALFELNDFYSSIFQTSEWLLHKSFIFASWSVICKPDRMQLIVMLSSNQYGWRLARWMKAESGPIFRTTIIRTLAVISLNVINLFVLIVLLLVQTVIYNYKLSTWPPKERMP